MLICKHCLCRVGLWGTNARRFWKHMTGGGKRSCGRRLVESDVVVHPDAFGGE